MSNSEASLGELTIHSAPGTPALPSAQLSHLVRLAHQILAAHPLSGRVELILADDAFVRSLNAAHRGMDAPTDVLTFDLSPASATPDAHIAGEIYVSLDRAGQQAEEQHVPLLEEIARLLTHGLLHLAGYEHDTSDALRLMEAETDRLLHRAGLIALPRSL